MRKRISETKTRTGATAAARPPRSRRSTAELRSAILESARTLFSERGYAATSTRDVAAGAGAVEALIFKHFKTKARLFHAAVFEPLVLALDRQLVMLEKRLAEPIGTREGLAIFVETLLPAMRDNERLLIAYLNAVTFHRIELQGLDALDTPLADYLRRFERIGANAARVSGLIVNDLVMETRLTFAIVAAVALFQDFLFAKSEQNIRRQQTAIVRLLSDGVGKFDAAASGPRSRARRR